MQFIVGLKKPQSTFVKLNGVGSKAGATICVVTNSKAYHSRENLHLLCFH